MEPLDRNTHRADNYHFHAEARRIQATAVATPIKELLGNPSVAKLDAEKAMADSASETEHRPREQNMPPLQGGYKYLKMQKRISQAAF